MAGQGKPLDQQTRERIVKMRDQGISIRQTAQALRLHQSTVHKIFKKRD